MAKRKPLTAYKLTDANDCTYGGMPWGPGVTHTASGNGELCGPGWIHVYSDPLLAVALNPIHADFAEPHLWRCEVGGAEKHDCGLKSGYTEVTTVERMEVPTIPTAALVRWSITLALQVYSDAAFERWAQAWLSGEDRSERAEWAAWVAARAAWVAAATEEGAQTAKLPLADLLRQAIAEEEALNAAK